MTKATASSMMLPRNRKSRIPAPCPSPSTVPGRRFSLSTPVRPLAVRLGAETERRSDDRLGGRHRAGDTRQRDLPHRALHRRSHAADGNAGSALRGHRPRGAPRPRSVPADRGGRARVELGFERGRRTRATTSPTTGPRSSRRASGTTSSTPATGELSLTRSTHRPSTPTGPCTGRRPRRRPPRRRTATEPTGWECSLTM